MNLFSTQADFLKTRVITIYYLVFYMHGELLALVSSGIRTVRFDRLSSGRQWSGDIWVKLLEDSVSHLMMYCPVITPHTLCSVT